MSKLFVIEAEKRETKGKASARALKRANRVPAVVYGSGLEPISISVDAKSLTKRYLQGHFKTQICEINIDGQKIKTLPKAVTLHTVNDNIIHVDFFKPNDKYKLKLSVPVHLENEDKSVGIKAGGVMNIAMRQIEILCTIDNIPESINVDVKDLALGSSLHQSDIALPQGVEFADKDNASAIISVTYHTEEKEEDAVMDVSSVVAAKEKAPKEEKAAPAKK